MTEYFRFLKISIPSKSGWFQARQKIKTQFFKDLLYRTIQWHTRYLTDHRWKGYRVLGVDGTAFRVPDNLENRKYFGQHTNQHNSIASCRFVAWFDVWNDIIFHLQRHSRKISEKRVAEKTIKDLPTDTISVYDRGYASTSIVWLHRYYGNHCIIRVNPDFSHIVKSFIASQKLDWVGDLRLGEGAFYALQKLGMKNRVRKFEPLPCRLIRIELSSGQTEVLLTTLTNQHEFKREHFNELYQKRWRVETCFDRLKNHLILGSFSGYRRQFVEQDIWATFIFHNLLTAFRKYAQDIRDIKTKKENKYNYQINHNVSAGILHLYFAQLFEEKPEPRSDLLWKVLALMAKSAEAQRPNRSRPRKRKMMRINDRHQTEKNYKRAL